MDLLGEIPLENVFGRTL